MQPQTFVFFGQAGSGKGTQIALLMEYLKKKDNKDIVFAGTGDGFRKLIGLENQTASLVKEYVSKGELVPDFLTNAIFLNILVSSLSKEKHLIADGYPRTVVQAESFEAMIKFYKRDNIKIIYIEISEEEAVKRNLKRGRADDVEEALRRRLNEYKNNVAPAMNYFKDKDGYEILTVNGEQSVERVQSDILKVLGMN